MAELVERAPAYSEEEEIFVAPQWRLVWWKFKKHKLALVSVAVLAVFYLPFVLAEFLSMGNPQDATAKFQYLRPQPLRWFDEGKFRPHVNGVKGYRDPKTFKPKYDTLTEEKLDVGFFVHGYSYKFLGFFKTDRHLIGFSDPEMYDVRHSLFLLGTDLIGRDAWSRLMVATRISLSIGMVGVALSLTLGVVLGAISGYYGGIWDTVIQRVIEILRSIPTIPLWMGLAAALPKDWGVLKIYFAITIIISIVGWTEMGRVVRGRFLSLREEDFVMAARLAGASERRIIFRHMLPSFTSHIIAATTLAIPYMIISETALSFLGLGLRPPAVSWGVMLQQATNAETVALYPWLMFVAVPFIIAVLAFNFMGDGLRDAADPYS